MRSISNRVLGIAGLLILIAVGTTPSRADQCSEQFDALERLSRTVALTIDAPASGTAADPVQVSWKVGTFDPPAVPIFLVVSVPHEVRFMTAALPAVAIPDDEDAYSSNRAPELPGFIALTPETRGPLQLAFGSGSSRTLVPLHRGGGQRSGSFQIVGLPAGSISIRAALVGRSSCGEQVASARFDRDIVLVPGTGDILVQDPYDIESPTQTVRSNNGRYRAHVFERRYRVYDVATGAKLVDRPGTDINFSPTSRFVVANSSSAGIGGRQTYELVDLATQSVIGGFAGPFIGFTEGDAFVLDGGIEWGRLTMRSTIVARPTPQRLTQLDGLSLPHPGECHFCASWSTSTVALDLDEGIVTYGGSDAEKKPRTFDLATGAVVEADKRWSRLPGLPSGQWTSRTDISFSHIYEPDKDPKADEYRESHLLETLDKARPLASHKVDHKRQTSQERGPISASEQEPVARGDWRSRTTSDIGTIGIGATGFKSKILAEVGRLGVLLATRGRVDAVLFDNTRKSSDLAEAPRLVFGNDFENTFEYRRARLRMEKRTKLLERRLFADVPAARTRIGDFMNEVGTKHVVPTELPLENPGAGPIYLSRTLEGAWRWEVSGRPIWLLQLWDNPNNYGRGDGLLYLLDGREAAGKVRALSPELNTFWRGQYGYSDHQSQLKPDVYLDRYLVMASVAARSIAVFDLRQDKVLHVLSDIPQADLLAETVLSSDARHVIQINSDGQYFIHEVASGRVVMSGRVVDDEVIAYTPEGYYWSSYEGAHFVQFRFPGLAGVFPFQQFASVLNRPDLVRAALKPGASPAPSPKLTAPPDLEMTAVAADGSGAVSVHVTARGSEPLKRLSLYADGQRIYDQTLSGATFAQDITVPNATDVRWLTAQVVDSKGLLSSPRSLRRPASGQPTRQLYAVTIGNDIYDNPNLTLNYASHDAERLGTTLKALPGKFYAKTSVETLVNGAATVEAIRSEIRRVVETARAEDTIVVSFAGHGVQEAGGTYYLTPHGYDEKRKAETALAWRELASLLHRAKARVIVILDACHAGLSGSEGLGTNDDAVAALVAGEHPPMLVLAASKGRQLSYEGDQYDGGLFTSTLIDVLQQKRADYDLDRDGTISVSELYRGLRSILARETQGQKSGPQSPWLVRQDLLGDFILF